MPRGGATLGGSTLPSQDRLGRHLEFRRLQECEGSIITQVVLLLQTHNNWIMHNICSVCECVLLYICCGTAHRHCMHVSRECTRVWTMAGRWMRRFLTVWKTSTNPSTSMRSRMMWRPRNTPVLPTPLLQDTTQHSQVAYYTHMCTYVPAVDHHGAVRSGQGSTKLLHLTHKFYQHSRRRHAHLRPPMELKVAYQSPAVVLCARGQLEVTPTPHPLPLTAVLVTARSL